VTKPTRPKRSWYFYVLQCADGTFYAGITTNPQSRLLLHNAGKGAKYLRPRKRRPASMVMLCRCASRSVALRAEARFKKLKRRDKELIIFFHGTGARFHCTRM